jgi:hypothetical protein
LLVLALPLALSTAMPVFARVMGGPAVHVCRCAVRGGHSTCACPVCHPDRLHLRLGKESIRGQCGDEDPVFGAEQMPALPLGVGPDVLRALKSAPPLRSSTRLLPDVVLSPPTPPPRLPLV